MRIVWMLNLILVLTACSDIHREEQLKRIDRLDRDLDSFSIANNRIAHSRMDSLIVHGKELKKLLMERKDTIDQYQASRIDSLLLGYASIGLLQHQNERLESVLGIRRKQLRKLRKQIVHAAGRRDQYDTNIDFEQHQIEALEMDVNNLVDRYHGFRAYDSLHFENVRNYLVSFKTKMQE